MKRIRVPSKMLQQRFAGYSFQCPSKMQFFAEPCLLMQAQTRSVSRYFDVLLASSPTFNSKSRGTDRGRLTFVAKENVQRTLSVYYSPYDFTSFGLVYNAKQLKVLRVLKSPPLFFTWFSNKHALCIWKASFESGDGLHRHFFAPRLR